MSAVAAHPRSPNLFAAAARWQRALDTAQQATQLATAPPVVAKIAGQQRALQHERLEVASALTRLARLYAIAPPHLPGGRVTERSLGVPAGTRACLFDLEGVLTDSGMLQALAWSEVLDDVLLRLAERTGRQFLPFALDDYRTYVEGRLRLDGVEAFLAARGIRLPAGTSGDSFRADTAHGLANRKAAALQRILHGHGVSALPGARRYLEVAGYAGVGRAVVSASAATLPTLELAGLTEVVDARIDAEVLDGEHLRSRPAPDVLLAACRRLGVEPHEAVSFTHTLAGVAAARAAGTGVVVVGGGSQDAALAAAGVRREAESLGALLDPHLLA